jgi:hypothetical protein
MENPAADEQAIIAEIREKYESLSEEAQATVAESVSWVEHYWGWIAPALLLLGIALGCGL